MRYSDFTLVIDGLLTNSAPLDCFVGNKRKQNFSSMRSWRINVVKIERDRVKQRGGRGGRRNARQRSPGTLSLNPERLSSATLLMRPKEHLICIAWTRTALRTPHSCGKSSR